MIDTLGLTRGTTMDDGHGADLPPDEHRALHDRRYVLFAVGLALVVLAFAAISITVVVTSSP
jgi:hypothetical protein